MIFQDGIFVKKNIEKSIDYYTKASNQGDLLAKINLNFFYSDDKTFDKEKTLKYLTEAADQNDPFAQYLLGGCCTQAKFGFSIKQGIDYLKKSADNGFIGAQYTLGLVYLTIPDIKNINESITYLELAIKNQNHTDIRCHQFYNNHGKYVLPNFETIFCYKFNNGKYYQILSMLLFAHIFSNVSKTSQKINRAIGYLSQISNLKILNLQDFLDENNLIKKYISQDTLDVALKSINMVNFSIINSPNYIGRIYMEGLYVPRDINRAIQYFKKCNNTISQCYLSLIYSTYPFNKEEVNEAIHYYHSVFEKSKDDLFNDFLDTVSLYKLKLCDEFQIFISPLLEDLKLMESIITSNIGDIYNEGIYINIDITKAINYYQISADKKNPFACFSLAIIYFNGKYIEKNINKAFHFFELAAKYDHTIAQYCLALFYYNGKYVPKNIKEAIKYFYVAANKDHRNSQFYIATIYYICEDYMRDMEIAIKYYRKASSFKDPYAKNNLGIIYKNGDGGKQNIGYSIIYLNEAIELNNNEVSRFNLAHIYFYGKGVEQDLNKTIQLLTSPPIQTFSSGLKLLCLAIIPKCTIVTKENIKKVINDCNPNCDISISNEVFREINNRELTDYYNYQIVYEIIEKEELVFTTVDDTFTTRASIEKKYQEQKNKTVGAYNMNNINNQFYEGFAINMK